MPTVPAHRAPRFVYLSDASRASDPTARYGWRLVAANYRPLGRGRLAEGSLDDCRSAAVTLQRMITDLESSVVTQHGLWTWNVTLENVPVAVCVHPYMRRVECLRGLTQFLTAVAAAEPSVGVVRYFGPHSLRGYLLAEPVIEATA